MTILLALLYSFHTTVAPDVLEGLPEVKPSFEESLDAMIPVISGLVLTGLTCPSGARKQLEMLMLIKESVTRMRPTDAEDKHILLLHLLGSVSPVLESVATAHEGTDATIRAAVFFSTARSMQVYRPKVQQLYESFRGPAAVRDSLEVHSRLFRNEDALARVRPGMFSLDSLVEKLDLVEQYLKSKNMDFTDFAEAAMTKILVWRAHLLRLTEDRPDLITTEVKVSQSRVNRLYYEYVPFMLVEQRKRLRLPFRSEYLEMSE